MKESERVAALLASARYQAGKTQEYMAEMMNKSTKTIGNWELGKSVPTITETIEWFRVLGMNPIPSLVAIVRPDLFWNLAEDDNKLDDALAELIKPLSSGAKRLLIYILGGKHGSSVYAVLNVIVCYLHLTLAHRFVFTQSILSTYKISHKLGRTINNENVAPDVERIEQLMKEAEKAINEGKNGYVDLETEDERI